ncbi:hypothetical protein FGO68_gene17792 [Halteria grandinella]|uniref:Major facilitator superfamily (MFS) profile domain-containing protein n=1 Tax=Halteria grandinella TaxID=5974 RepID=A0A8J8NQ84_HALGN|nr:hypothetical protein FGO68_gene17792 [Halteria grandinella]
MFPKYKCDESITGDCDHVAHCDQPLHVSIDWADPWSLDNWVSRYGLECVDPFRIALLGSMYFSGTTLFGIVVNRMGDLYGRKWPVRASALLSIPIHGLLLVSTDLTLTSILFFLIGALSPGKCQVAFTYAGEFLKERERQVIGSMILFCDSSAMVLLPLYFKFVSKYWLYFHVVSFSLNVISALLIFMVPESPKYLIGKHQPLQALESLNKIARFNGLPILTEIQGIKEQQEITTSTKDSSLSISYLLKDIIHRRNLILAIIIWSTVLLGYYTIYFHIRYLGGDFFFNSVAFGGTELTAYFFGSMITQRVGVKNSFTISLLMTAFSGLMYALFRSSHPELLPLVLACGGFGVVWGCNICWNSNATLFPVVFSSSTNGVCNLFGRFACAVAPQVAEGKQPYPMLIIAASSLMAAFCSRALVVGK